MVGAIALRFYGEVLIGWCSLQDGQCMQCPHATGSGRRVLQTGSHRQGELPAVRCDKWVPLRCEFGWGWMADHLGTDRKIIEALKKQPQVTFACNKEDEKCTFQCKVLPVICERELTVLVWVDQRESFYCDLTKCDGKLDTQHDKNVTDYECKKVDCECIPGRALCGEENLDLTDFLKEEITGPATFQCDSSKTNDQCIFSEDHMNQIISSIFGDPTILLNCGSGECLHKSEVPGYTRPIKTINKPLIAGVIAGCALFIVMVVLGLWWASRRANQKRGLGAIHLPEDDDEALGVPTGHKPAALHFCDVSYQLNGKQILEGVRGAVSPGQVMAVMGPSGAGKTTFLDILARKNKRGQVSGKFMVNGARVTDEDYKEISGFVDQEETMMATLTVYETILNSALLRLPRDMNFQAKDKRVVEVMAQLGINGIRDQLIGTSEDNGIRGISGGEKRRVSIACELVTSPSILFLDEPTSGLDSFNAYNVVECLVKLAKNYRRTVIFTIHQPKSNIVALFDQLVLLARGRCIYSGPFDRCQTYFDKQGYRCPPGFNIADYLVDLTVHADQRRAFPEDDNVIPEAESSSSARPRNSEERLRTRKRGSSIREEQAQRLFTKKRSNRSLGPGLSEDGVMMSDDLEPRRSLEDSAETDALLLPSVKKDTTDLDVLITAYKVSDVAKEIQEEIDTANTPSPDGNANGNGQGLREGNGIRRVGWIGQFMILSARTWKNLYRNPMLMLAHYAISIVLACLCGYLFFGVRDDISGFQNRLGLFFFILALFGFSTLTSLNVFAAERTLFLRERANGYYSPITYFSAKVLFDIVPLRIIPPAIMATILYPMVGLVAQWPEFFKLLLVLVLFNLAASAICLFIGIVCKDNSLSNLIGSLVMLFSLLFAGLLLNRNSIPKSAQWLQNMSIFHYAFEAMIVNEVRYLTLIEHK